MIDLIVAYLTLYEHITNNKFLKKSGSGTNVALEIAGWFVAFR